MWLLDSFFFFFKCVEALFGGGWRDILHGMEFRVVLGAGCMACGFIVCPYNLTLLTFHLHSGMGFCVGDAKTMDPYLRVFGAVSASQERDICAMMCISFNA